MIFNERKQRRFLFSAACETLTLPCDGVSKFVSNDTAGIEYCCVGIELYGFCNASAFKADPQRQCGHDELSQ